jgi:hypothetical protein
MRYGKKAAPPLKGDAAKAKQVIDELRDQGDVRRSPVAPFCVRLVLKPGRKPAPRLVLKPGRKPAPCPVCGAMVTARAPKPD